MATLKIDTRKILTDSVNDLIKNGVNTNEISDGYHTFGELYEHRITLFIALCKMFWSKDNYPSGANSTVWKSEFHSDGSKFEGWFILGLFQSAGSQITYHLPMSKWDECDFAQTFYKAPEFDGHTSADVLQRLKEL